MSKITTIFCLVVLVFPLQQSLLFKYLNRGLSIVSFIYVAGLKHLFLTLICLAQIHELRTKDYT